MNKLARSKTLNSINDRLITLKHFLTRHETIFVVVMLFVVAFLSYGVQLDDLGLYWDDWGVFWVEQNLGPQGVIDGHKTDRPLIGYNHAMLSTLFGRNITYYHLYSFSLRLLGAYAFLWLVRLVWPDQRFFTTMMTILFLVYPGFLSQPLAHTKSNHLTAFLLVIVSFALMVKALNTENRYARFLLWGLSLLTGAAYYFYFEYLLGFELARAVLLGYLIWRGSQAETKKKIVKLIKTWLPYFIVICLYLFWRVYVFESGRQRFNVDSLFGSYFGTGVSLTQYLTFIYDLLVDYLELIVLAWFVPAYHFITNSYLRPAGSALLLGSITAVLVAVYFWIYSKEHQEEEKENGKNKFSLHWVVLGLVLLILTNFLPVFAGRQYQILMTYKSYGLHIAFPVSILMVGIFIAVVRFRYRLVVVAGLVFLAVTAHNLNATKMSEYWEMQQELWWQVSWRVPDLEEGTTLWVRLPTSIGLTADFETWSPANFIYAEPGSPPKVSSEVLNKNELHWLQHGTSRERNFRGAIMVKDYGRSLVMSIPSFQSCLNVYDQNKLEFSEYAEPLVQVAATYSDLDLVIWDSAGHVPPEEVFGPEPEHRWCYYYQKASLARQAGDWDEVIRLLDEASKNGFRANDLVEWMPFFEAYVNLGMYEEARALKSIIKSSPNMAKQLCVNLPEEPGYAGEYDYEKVYELLCQ